METGKASECKGAFDFYAGGRLGLAMGRLSAYGHSCLSTFRLSCEWVECERRLQLCRIQCYAHTQGCEVMYAGMGAVVSE